jgi:hypothetical protein
MKTIFLKSTTTRPLFGSANKRPGVTRNGILTGASEHRLRFLRSPMLVAYAQLKPPVWYNEQRHKYKGIIQIKNRSLKIYLLLRFLRFFFTSNTERIV